MKLIGEIAFVFCCIICVAVGVRFSSYETSISNLTQRVERIEQRQLDLITYNDCMVCHPQEKRCELINGVVWEWTPKEGE